MKRFLLVIAGAAAIGVVAPAAANARMVELGATTTPLVAPTCPKGVPTTQCLIILNRVTALETIRDDIAYPTTVKQRGRLVAFSVGLSALSTNPTTAANDVKFLDKTYGGDAEVAVTVLKLIGNKNLRRWEVVQQSPPVDVQSYLGQVIQIPLNTTLPVVRGETIALTTPTWTPSLTIDLSTATFAYRQSRATDCFTPPTTSQAQVTVGGSTRYVCDYPGTRVEYSATEITNPVPTTPVTTTKRKIKRIN